MATLWYIIRAFDLRHVGQCPTCMRISFGLMALSWTLVFTAAAMDLSALPMTVGSAGLTFVWLAHIMTRSIQSVVARTTFSDSRRKTLKALAKGILAAALVSAFPLPAHALSGCGGWAGNSGCSGCRDGTGVTSCERQDNDCTCYFCRSCGNGCGENVC
jgi:hypothetical protein